MNKVASSVLLLVKMIEGSSPVLSIQRKYKCFLRMSLFYGIALFLFFSAYIFACISLYSFLVPYWGEAFSALFICTLFLGLSFGVVLVSRRKKSCKQDSPSLDSCLETSSESMPNFQEMVDVLQKASPQILAGVAGGLAILTVVKLLKKKE